MFWTLNLLAYGHTPRNTKLRKLPEALLVVWTGTADEYPDVLSLDESLVLLQGPHNPLEGGRHVGEVGDPATDDENLAVGVNLPDHRGIKKQITSISIR